MALLRRLPGLPEYPSDGISIYNNTYLRFFDILCLFNKIKYLSEIKVGGLSFCIYYFIKRLKTSFSNFSWYNKSCKNLEFFEKTRKTKETRCVFKIRH